MSEPPKVHPSPPPPPPTPRAVQLTNGAIVLGAISSIIGIVVGFAMAFHRREVVCPNGTEFPEGETDLRCFSYPHAGEGTGLVIVCVLLGLPILLVGTLVISQVRAAESNHRQDEDSTAPASDSGS